MNSSCRLRKHRLGSSAKALDEPFNERTLHEHCAQKL